MLSKPFNFFICFLFLFTIPNSFFVKAATSNVDLIQQNWPFNGIFGRFDKASLQRGFKVYSEVCSACHGLRHISYRDLEGIGYSNDEIKVIAGEYEITDGPNDEGEMFTRDAKMSDKFVGPYENDKIARLANNGAYPPDLSLIVKARGGGADYIYSLLNGYKDFPEDFEASDGMYYNEYYPGKQIALKTQYAWNQQFESKINVVLGDEWNAGNLSYHLKSRPVWEGIVEREKLDQLKDFMCLDNICVGSR